MKTELMPVAILAGGLATRLRPLTETVPKVLVEVGGKPFLAHQLELLRDSGIQDVVLCLGFLGEMVEQQFGSGDRFELRLHYSYDGTVLRGTGGAVRHALPMLGPDFFVMYGDSYLRIDLAAVQQSFRRSDRKGLMTVFRNENSWDTSNVMFDSGEIRAYDKRVRTPEMHHIDYGLSAFRAEAFARYAAEEPLDLATVLSDLLSEGQLAGFEAINRFYEIGSHSGLRELHELLTRTGQESRLSS